MTDGNLELVGVLVWWAVVGPTSRAVVRFDEKRLSDKALEHAWPPVSRDAAWLALWLVGFFPVYLLAFFAIHFGRTRGSMRGVGLGIAWTVAAILAGIAAEEVVGALIDAVGG
jgi:hypothetical protein